MACINEPNRRKIQLIAAVITLALAIFDVGTDWWALKDFIIYGGKINLTYALAIFCVIATILFIFELRNGIYAVKVQRSGLGDKEDVGVMEMKGMTKVVIKKRPFEKAEKHLGLWQEIVSFLLLALEDLPVTIILYVAFTKGPCDLFWRIFEESFTANLTLLGTFLASMWKVLRSMLFCCCFCCDYHDIDGICKKVGCCCCRLIRPIFAILLVGFSAYLCFTFNARGIKSRPDCPQFNTTL